MTVKVIGFSFWNVLDFIDIQTSQAVQTVETASFSFDVQGAIILKELSKQEVLFFIWV